MWSFAGQLPRALPFRSFCFSASLQYCAKDVIYLHKIYDSLNKILARENRNDLYNKTIKFIRTRVELDFASFKEDIWSH